MIKDQLQRPLRDLRISVIDRCNFRCPYCMPKEHFHQTYRFLDKKDYLSFDEIERLARIFVALGVRKLRLTGGEPLLRVDIDKLIAKLNAIDGVEDLALTTNGSQLRFWAKRLKAAGLRRLTVSLDTLDPTIFKTLSGGRGQVQDVLAGIKAAEAEGFDRIKINTVITRGVNESSILDLVRHFRGTPHVLRFIEYMDVGNQNHWDLKNVVSSKEVMQIIQKEYAIKKISGTEGGNTAEQYVYADGRGEVEFISSITHAFCGTCNRMRLSAKGELFTCLFARKGQDLKSMLVQGNDFISSYITDIWEKRSDRYSELRSLETPAQASQSPKVEMSHIGG